MSKKLFLIISCFTLFVSCDNTPVEIQKDAESLCNCFSAIYSVNLEDTVAVNKMNGQMAECNKLWKEIYDKYKDDETNKKTFNQAYNTCQDN